MIKNIFVKLYLFGSFLYLKVTKLHAFKYYSQGYLANKNYDPEPPSLFFKSLSLIFIILTAGWIRDYCFSPVSASCRSECMVNVFSSSISDDSTSP